MRKLLGFSKNDVEACFDSFGWLSDRCAVLWRKIKCDFFSLSRECFCFGKDALFWMGRAFLHEKFFHE